MNTKILLITLVVLFITVRCSDFVEEENKSNIPADEFYTKKDGYENLVNSTYSSLREVYNMPWVFEAGTDIYVMGRGDAQPEPLFEYKLLTPTEINVLSFYTSCYKAIQRCNTAIYYSERTEQSDILPIRVAEVKFLRAYYYFLLVQQFGGVAIVTERFEEPVLEFKRNTAEEVYAFIISEMDQALTVLEPATSQAFGRVTAKVVQHYLAKVHLTRGYEPFAAGDDFTRAAAYADVAIGGKSLSISFKDLFWPGKEKNDEVLFSIQYDKTSIAVSQRDGSNQNAFFGPYMGGEGAARGYPYRMYTLAPSMHLFNLFLSKDELNNTTTYDSRFYETFMLEIYDRYYDYYDRNSSLNTLSVWYFYAPPWVDEATWRAADPARRSKATVVKFENWEATTNSQDRATPPVKKFDDPTSLFIGNTDGNSTRDIYLARLGETYLIAAEAYFKAGNPSLAAQRINEVRRRAALPGQEAKMMISEADVTIDFILDERARELVGEYHRWMDLKRTGKLVERVQAYNTQVKAKYFARGVNPFTGADGELKILRPIPQQALDLNQAEVPQNPGY
ncbi:RagB/SusD family nutrient uptake outer membrane protein [Chryseosolibacter indicus]|uniref:RagB/SusD family nutrient uptake outer membrane protein n=1 Tax=Chryseosolibacter indicus TaxID=2782351 RepID=A0ABS5VRQ9_9BACT|nr:RagB/SusD family nutrient uptake outer membrane protein [Chryseosolibacter indicus]MBT1704031.1 RagB/SusD family nutrient uptake outer membrane protein [Chryseosolibacter indicus]